MKKRVIHLQNPMTDFEQALCRVYKHTKILNLTSNWGAVTCSLCKNETNRSLAGQSDKIIPLEERISKLPKWAQDHIVDLQTEISLRNGLVDAHALLSDKERDWFTIRNLQMDDSVMNLWILNKNNPFPVCSISQYDILIVGRGKRRQDEKADGKNV